MSIAVDSNILFDILLPDPRYQESSLSLLTEYGNRHSLIISEIVYGELAAQFPDRNLLLDFLAHTDIRLVNSGPDALWISSKAWQEYSKTRPVELQCVACGNMQRLICEKCDTVITCRQHILSDFLIGGHALVYSGKLLTRDRGYYRRYFPGLKLVI
ncbi:MAG: type II toxin-antitoxin system VapC family toxin [Firmicutes bacterium]|nr:type II toxin-antitoxin system VapC family toxin [Bacillota bacterium]